MAQNSIKHPSRRIDILGQAKVNEGLEVYPVYTVPPESDKVFKPALVPSIPDPRRALSYHAGGGLQQVSRAAIARPKPTRRAGTFVEDSTMSPFLQPPPERRRPWAESSNFVPSQVGFPQEVAARRNNPMASIIVTPTPKPPNTIPVGQPVHQQHPNVVHQILQQTARHQEQQQKFQPKFTAQQIIRQQMDNQNKAAEKAENVPDLLSQPSSSDQFWTTINNSNKNRKVGTNNAQVKLTVIEAEKPKPKLKFDAFNNTDARIMHGPAGNLPLANQFMSKLPKQTQEQIKVFNPGASGLQVVEASVPINQQTNSFSVGSSVVVGGGQKSPQAAIRVIDLQPEIGVYPTGEDSNILHAKQVPAGTPLPQGPHGPIIPTPRPSSFAIAQTPNAPQVLRHPMLTPVGRRVGGGQFGSHNKPGPGSYQPPIGNTPSPLGGRPDSGQQLIKHYLMHKNVPTPRTTIKTTPRPKPTPARPMRPGPKPYAVNRQGEPPARVPGFGDRQDIVSAAAGAAIPAAAALGAISSTLTPMSIFSNLLNAYATLDTKHDITNQLVKSASNWLGTETSTAASTLSTTSPTTQTPVPISVRSSVEDDDVSAFQAIVVDSDGFPPVRSNVNLDQPLRPKPPSEGGFRVTPAPNYYHSSNQYGVDNPHFYSDDLNPVADKNYGPNDFVVETVKLDKAFFHQFFTSKPLLLGTNVVTSKSVRNGNSNLRKQGRQDASGSIPSLLESMVLSHNKNQPSRTTTTTTTTTERPEIKNNVKTFKRYHIPAEVKISHSLRHS